MLGFWELTDSPTPTKEDVNFVFLALALTCFGVLAAGNLILGHTGAVRASLAIFLAAASFVIVFYGLTVLLSSVAWGAVCALGALVVVAYDSSGFGKVLFYVITIAGFGLVIKHLRVSLSRVGPLFLMAGIATIMIIGVDGYTSFDMMQRMHVGRVHQDTLFHASIAAMIKNYGVASTGLNGLTEINYHTLSHALMAGISKLSGRGILDTYGVVLPILLIPLMLGSIVFASCALLAGTKTSIPIIWSGACLSLFLQPWLLREWAFWDSYFISESYALSIAFLSLGLLPLFKRTLLATDLLLIVLLSAILASSKSSVGMIYGGLWALRALFLRTGRLKIELLAATASLTSVLLVIWPSIGVTKAQVTYFHFIEAYSYLGKNIGVAKTLLATGGGQYPASALLLAVSPIAVFILLHFFPSWVVLFLAGWRNGWRGWFLCPGGLYTTGALLAGLLFVVFFEIPGGSVYFFSNVAFFVSLPVLLGVVSRSMIGSYSVGQLIRKEQTFLWLAFVLAIFVTAKPLNKASFESAPANGSGSLVDQLLAVRKKTGTNMVIQASEELLKQNPVSQCTAQPFVYPAISERPWIGVIRLDNRCRYEYYGYERYNVAFSQARILPNPALHGFPIVPFRSAFQLDHQEK